MNTRYSSTYRQLNRLAPFLLAVFALYRFIGLGFGELQQWDEAIYALRTLHVLHFDQIFYQHGAMLHGIYYAGHPPLYVWLSSFWVSIFGDVTWAYRITSALAVAAAVPALYFFVRKHATVYHGLLAAGFLAFAPLPTFYSRQGQLNVLLMLLMLCVFLAYDSSRFQRYQKLLLAGICLGLALMTKFLHALSIPAAMAVAGVLLYNRSGRRYLTDAATILIISLPIWLPWVIGFQMNFGDGEFVLTSSAMPFGKVAGGDEGTDKVLGKLFYANQLVVQLSVLFPYFILGWWDALRQRREGIGFLLAVFLAGYVAVLHLMSSAFTVYLLPLFPYLLFLGVQGLRRLPALSVAKKTVFVIASLCSGLWALSLDLREAVKAFVQMLISGAPALDSQVLMAAAVLILLLTAVATALLLRERSHLTLAVAPKFFTVFVAALALTTMVRIWRLDPLLYYDGIEPVASQISKLGDIDLISIGDGDNPQLNYYLYKYLGMPGSIDEMYYTRLEPSFLGTQAVADSVEARSQRYPSFILVETDEIRHGRYSSPEDVLPETEEVILTTKRYAMFVILGGSSCRTK
ncbi:MAG: hypothetical protein CL946_03850 [Ectothiorhodospiraceae bacterium]|nr:hypothetical protein [Ectothiorhodospiraceae bacterium]